MKKLFERAATWLRLHVMNVVEERRTIGGFEFVFRRYDLTVRTLSGNFRTRIMCTEHPFAYLAHSLRDGREDNLHGYASLLYIVATQLTQDAPFARAVESGVKRYMERLEREGRKREKNVDRSDDLREMSEVLAAELKSKER